MAVDLATHKHVWGRLERSALAGTVHRKCQVDGCSWINAYDDPTEFCAEDGCGRHFEYDEDGGSHHLSATSPDQIDHKLDADHDAWSDPDEDED